MTKRFLPLLAFLALAGCSGPNNKAEIKLATPSPQQIDFMNNEIGAFFHFTTNTFTGAEHGDGTATPADFNPTKLDVDQWMEAAKSLGAKYAVLTARHEDGFCLWPTKTTEYCVRNSPWKNGRGDVVKEFVEACRRHGIKPGLYFSPNYNGHEIFQPKDRPVEWGKVWDSITNLRWQDSAFVQKYRQLEVDQITELLTDYGPIYQIWMDHWSEKKNCPAVTAAIRKLQPECILTGPDVRSPGNEKGTVVYPSWNPVYTMDSTNNSRAAERVDEPEGPNEYGLLETYKIVGHPNGQFWRSLEGSDGRHVQPRRLVLARAAAPDADGRPDRKLLPLGRPRRQPDHQPAPRQAGTDSRRNGSRCESMGRYDPQTVLRAFHRRNRNRTTGQ